MSNFARKAIVHISGQNTTTLIDGREGNELKLIAKRLKSTLNLTNEQIDDYYDTFIMYPLDNNNQLTISSIQLFYSNSDIELTYEDALKSLQAFTGERNIHSIDFETFVVNMEKWIKKEIHHPEVLKMACTIYDEEGPNINSVQRLLENIDGPQLSTKKLSSLADAINQSG